MAEQSYSNPASRNVMSAADIKGGAKPGKVSVPEPGTDKTQPAYKGGVKMNPPGFSGGVIEGKIKV